MAARLVLGILGLVSCIPLGIAAWVMGNNDLAAIARGRMDPEGEGLTRAGKICGMVSVGLLVLGLMVWVLMFVSSWGWRPVSRCSGDQSATRKESNGLEHLERSRCGRLDGPRRRSRDRSLARCQRNTAGVRGDAGGARPGCRKPGARDRATDGSPGDRSSGGTLRE